MHQAEFGSGSRRASLVEADLQMKRKHTFKPMDRHSKLNEDEISKERVHNLQPIQNGEKHPNEINLRCMVNMDQEPMHFLQSFEGGIVVTTGAYQ
jgi:hypothetical protein